MDDVAVALVFDAEDCTVIGATVITGDDVAVALVTDDEDWTVIGSTVTTEEDVVDRELEMTLDETTLVMLAPMDELADEVYAEPEPTKTRVMPPPKDWQLAK